MTTNAAVYARISKDDGSALGVARQIEDCTGEAERRGWQVTHIYTDNDVSASNGKARPEFQRMMREVDAGRLKAIVVWDADRLSRDPRENEDLIDRAEQHGLKLANVGGDMDLSTVSGRLTFRIKGSVAKAEVEQASRRIKRKFDERASHGLPHGKAAFGYRRMVDYDDTGRRVGSRDVLDEAQASVVRETAKRLLTGESLRSIVKALNDKGSASPGGKPWNSTTLRQVMLRDRNAGLRRHRGAVVGKGNWEPIYDEGTHNRVLALLTDPARRSSKGASRRHLLSGIARCGRCGGPMRHNPGGTHKGKTVQPRYQCSECMRVVRKQAAVDDYVTMVVLERLRQPQAVRALAAGRPERAEELHKLIADATARLDLVADGFADGEFTAEQLRRVTTKLAPQIGAWQAELAGCAPHDGLMELVGDHAEAKWQAAPLDVRRMVIRSLLAEITINTSKPGRAFHGPSDVTLVPVGRAGSSPSM
jgi:site-specific DNA recombinase